MQFNYFFSTATGHAPYDYQRRLGSGQVCQSQLISIPTGLGKTAAVVLAWLWNRVVLQRSDWSRRLVYCLPMRTLVEQTRDNAQLWVLRLALAATKDGSLERSTVEAEIQRQAGTIQIDAERERWINKVRAPWGNDNRRIEGALTSELGKARSDLIWLAARSPVILMGGEELDAERRDWDVYPEKPAILIGTQDMLLSRALNRGYGMSRYRWPMHFALLNHDALWVLDETQLIGVGIETSAQLDALRHAFAAALAAAATSPRAFTWWMSATLAADRLATVDQPHPLGLPRLELADADLALSAVKERFYAHKPLAPADGLALVSTADREVQAYAKRLAEFVQLRHRAGTLTMVVLNNVTRAQAVYRALHERGVPAERLALVHSRFRPADRARHQTLLFAGGDRIVVATQAVEAGIDVSARLLVTELAPCSSLVQRFGRCNRTGEFNADRSAEIYWLDLLDDDKVAAPYRVSELAAARRLLLTPLREAGPHALAGVAAPPEAHVVRPVLRRKDLLDLFDTTPDLAGQDLDVSRYVRDGDDNDVQVFWRNLGGAAPAPEEPEPTRAELCRVSLPRFRDFLERLHKKDATSAFLWDPLDAEWSAVRHARAGGVYLLDVRAGGYSAELGWTGELRDAQSRLPPIAGLAPSRADAAEDNATDRGAQARTWMTLAEHTRHVVDTAKAVAAALGLPAASAATLATAARWHDLGKAHAVFQAALKGAPAVPPPDASALYAKSPNRARPYASPGFRHELASALAVLLAAPADLPARDLVAYLVAAHHGKVRLSIRSLPGETPPADRPDARCARGVVDADPLPAAAFATLGLGARSADLALDLGFMELGDGEHGPSWLARSLALRDRLGPFQLAYLETLLRAADMRASAAEAHNP